MLSFKAILFAPNKSKLHFFRLTESCASLSKRKVYTREAHKIHSYEVTRKQYEASTSQEKKETFISLIQDKLNKSVKSPTICITPNELKNVIYLGNAEDSEMLLKMAKNFNSQNRELCFSKFHFGTEIMRFAFYIDDADLALRMIKDKDLYGLFSEMSCYSIAMTLLYNHGKYQDILDLYNFMVEHEFSFSHFSKFIITTVIASCYQLNTPEALAYANKVVTAAKENQNPLTLRTMGFLIALHVKQGLHEEALKLITKIKVLDPISTNLKMIALISLGQYAEAMDVPHSLMVTEVPPNSQRQAVICQDTLDLLEETLKEKDKKDLLLEFEKMCAALKEHNLVVSTSLEDYITQPIALNPPKPNYSSMGRPFRYHEQQRPGLFDYAL